MPDAVLQRIERADDGAAAEGIALSRELLTALAGRIAGAYFMPPFERFAVVQETLEGPDAPGAAAVGCVEAVPAEAPSA